MFERENFFKKHKLDFKLIREIDKALLISIILLVLFGILNIYLCTKAGVGNITYPYYFVKKQITWFIISLVAMYILVSIDYSIIFEYVPIFYWFSVILLVCVWIPGIGKEINGARGWIKLGISIQPAELAKFALILMIAKLIHEMDGEINDVKNFFKIVFYAIIPVGLIAIQPDMGMTMVCFFIVLGIVAAAGFNRKIIVGGLTTLAIAIVIIVNSGLLPSYQVTRFTAFLDPEKENSDAGYQLNQALIGMGSGGILGSQPSLEADGTIGYAASNVPEIQTDFIFTAIAEQCGLVGALFVIILYSIIIVQMVKIARQAKDLFGSLLVLGMVSYLLFAITENIGMNIGLMPITGITLPMVSYGGSSLLTTLMAMALVLNVGMRKKKIHF
ncbi:MAG: rod shape-determining protein RodA [Clostridium sp.]|nr:rod shape-determining protein RodA [Clostridium sp.]MCI7443407.1 rod shape-determining protein RodA [Clostridium sp.]